MPGPRVPPLPREEWTEAARDVFAFWEGDEARANGSRSNTMMTLANHPKLALASLELGKYFMLESSLSARQLKLLILRVAHRNGSNYQWIHNSLGAKQIGVSEEEIEAVKTGPTSPVWNDADRVFLQAIDLACDGGKLDEPTWQALTGLHDRRFVMDLIHAAGYFSMVAWGLVAMGVEVEADFAEFSRNRAKD